MGQTGVPTDAYKRAGIDFEREYQLVLCSVLLTEVEARQWDPPVFRYAVGNIAGEILLGEFTCSRVFDYFLDGHIYVAVIADSCRPDTCRRLVDSCKSHLQCQMVVYCGAPCPASQLSQQRVFWEKADRNNVARVLPVIETVSQLFTQEENVSLDVEQLRELLRQGRSLETVNTVRRAIESAEKGKKLSALTLHSLRQDFTQAVFSCLLEEHILAHELFQDPGAKQLERVCESSVFDMIKWANFVAKKMADTIQQVRKSENVVEKMKRYIDENLCHELTREEIAQYVFLSPDYAAKLFKTETGILLKAYIDNRKMDKAKTLLTEGHKNVSEVATAVGFDNFAYFSTLFKKNTGLSPIEYKKKKEAGR